MSELFQCWSPDTWSSAFLFVARDFLCEYSSDIAEIKEMSCVADWCVSMYKSWSETHTRAAYGRHKADLRLETHFSSPHWQDQLAKTWLLAEVQRTKCFNKCRYQMPRLLIQPERHLQWDWENMHKQRHFLHLQRGGGCLWVVPLLRLFSPMLSRATFRRSWCLSIQTHNHSLPHL